MRLVLQTRFPILLLFLLLNVVQSCYHEGLRARSTTDSAELVRSNNLRRNASPPKREAFAITNVRVFDGHKILSPRTVFVDDGRIVAGPPANNTKHIDGQGDILLPGLIDAHTHPKSVDDLKNLTAWGVTTTMSMMCAPDAVCRSLKNHTGLTDVLYAGASATSQNSTHASLPGYPQNETMSSPDDVPAWIAARIAEDVDFIKVIAENAQSPNTLDQDTLNALADAGHRNGLPVACHAAAYNVQSMVLLAGCQFPQHSPLDHPLNDTLANQYLAQFAVSTPTLTMMVAIFMSDEHANFAAANTSVGVLYEAGVPILAGTDSVSDLGLNISYVQFGLGLHQELELLVEAGMSTVDVLRATTVLPAQYYRLNDRGIIAPGVRADMVLISGDPIANISNTKNIRKVWIEGIEFGA
ncbi:putative hydrolase [Hymenopellis radicata]|nr:putative hydrolase [Hymenopellis radicata]